MRIADVHYLTDASGNVTAALVPIALWREIVSELETALPLRSEPMRRRLLEAKERTAGFPLEEVQTRLGL